MAAASPTDAYKDRIRGALSRFESRVASGAYQDPGPRKPARLRAPQGLTEYQEQVAVCAWLKAARVLYAAVPNGAHLAGGAKQRGIQVSKLKRAGMKAGVPDLLIFTPPPSQPEARGVALEMKRAKNGRLSEAQRDWLEDLEHAGWVALVGHGAEDAIEKLMGLGYAG